MRRLENALARVSTATDRVHARAPQTDLRIARASLKRLKGHKVIANEKKLCLSKSIFIGKE